MTLSTDDPLMFHTTKDVMGGLKSEGRIGMNFDEVSRCAETFHTIFFDFCHTCPVIGDISSIF